MSDLPGDFDLKFLPDWLKEGPIQNPYANFEGEGGDRPRRDRDDRSPRGPRPERRGAPGPRGDSRGPRPDRPAGDRNRGPGGGSRPEGMRAGGGGGGGGGGGREQEFRAAPRPQREVAPAQLRVEFLPEANAAMGIAKQIRTSGHAFAVFGTSKLFLDRPERHVVRVTSSDPAVPLFQVGRGPISFHRGSVERDAWGYLRDEYYKTETVQGEPLKGNFTNVARCRSVRVLLGPTNHHSYQSALRKLYEDRFRRQMSFGEFQQREIEVVNDAAVVDEWKEQARSSTSYSTTQEAEAVIFSSLGEAEAHFRKVYLPGLLRSGTSLECSGQASRAGTDRYVTDAVRAAWEAESRFPQQLVNALCPYFGDAGLTFFKHRKKMLYVCTIKPQRHLMSENFSQGISMILQVLETAYRVKRPELAAKILGATDDAAEGIARKAQLASDLHYLILAGHVIEFSDGSLELPLDPRARPEGETRPMRKKSPEGTGSAVGKVGAVVLESIAAENVVDIAMGKNVISEGGGEAGRLM